jgi:hypothetical protein
MRVRASALVAVAVCVGPTAGEAADDRIVRYEVAADFADVLQDLEDAIVNRGYVIDFHARIGAMLNRTAGDVGAEQQVFLHADGLQFCSATLSRRAVEADPANIAYCPYVLYVYELADAPGAVTVAYRQLDTTGPARSFTALAEINALLDEIAREAAGLR